jgi:hypothetical protein
MVDSYGALAIASGAYAKMAAHKIAMGKKARCMVVNIPYWRRGRTPGAN